MLDLDGLPLHQSRFASTQIVCTPEMQVSIKDYFNDHGFEVHPPLCFSHNSSDKLSIMFELATQARKLAGAIMGLLNRNDIEISLCTRNDAPKTAKVKLRDVEDAEVCERLLDKLAALVITPRQDNP